MEYNLKKLYKKIKENEIIDSSLEKEIKEEINQTFSNKKDWINMEIFYKALLKISLSEDNYKKIISFKFNKFQDNLIIALKKLEASIKNNEEVKAIHYYMYDDGEYYASFNPCVKYDKTNLNWSAYVINGRIIEDNNSLPLSECMSLYVANYKNEILPFGKLNFIQEISIYLYIDAMIISSLGQALNNFKFNIPFLVAYHDDISGVLINN